ncbi:hypothetical protein BBJ28_00000156 [Nothophytophthora sp. Chile5]|nr:hypothetical protein BBJ28_00000156 [Nothophytophthora sp. Chile5]
MLATRYELLDKIGNGAFGEVHRAKALRSGDVCAVKRLRVNDDGQLAVVPAAHSTDTVNADLQIVKLLDVMPDGSHIALVLEYMPTDLHSVRSCSLQAAVLVPKLSLICVAVQILRHRDEPFEAADVRGLLRMLLHGDLKPGNLLLSAEGVLKLSDFGLATVFVGRTGRSYSHQVATRWYRAPELLFGARQYDAAVDMWAVGAIFAELLRLTPLFPGQNDLDQLFRVIQVLGDIEKQWPGVRELPDYNKVRFPAYDPMPLSKLFPDAEKSAVDLLSKLLALDPSKRLSAQQVGKMAALGGLDGCLTAHLPGLLSPSLAAA